MNQTVDLGNRYTPRSNNSIKANLASRIFYDGNVSMEQLTLITEMCCSEGAYDSQLGIVSCSGSIWGSFNENKTKLNTKSTK